MKRQYLSTTAMAVLLAAGLAGEVRAQAAAAQPPVSAEPAQDRPLTTQDSTGVGPEAQDAELEGIVVTGSLIRRAPTVSVAEYDRKQFELEGTPTMDAILDRNPIQFSGYNKSDQNYLGGEISGTKSVNLRGLYRTLPLFNGRRMLPAGGLTNSGIAPIDVAMLPIVALDRIETLRSGGSTLYGSDAIAGVWNFITRRNFEGLELQAEHQYYEGGGETTLGAIMGIQGERVRWTASAEYYKADVLTLVERRPLVRYANPAEGGFNTGFSSVSFPGIVSTSPPAAGLPAGANARFDPLCGTRSANNPLISTWRAGTATAPVCQWTFVGYNNFVDAEERYKFFTEMSGDITDNIEVYGSFIWSTSNVEWNTVPFYPNNNLGTGHNPNGVHFFIPRDNPGYNAFLAALPAADRPLFDPGVTFNGLQGLWLRARPDIFSEPRKSGPREREWKQLVFGVRGDIPYDFGFVKNLSYDISAYYQQRDFYISTPDVLSERYKLALVGLGGPLCRPPSQDPFSPLNASFRNNAAQNCYSWNPFGNAATAAPGSREDNRADVREWFVGESSGDTDAESSTIDAVLRGETSFELPGGTIGFAIGAQSYLFDEDVLFPGDNGYDVPPPTPPLQFLGVNSPKQYDVTSHRKAIFGELAIPLLENLDVQLAVRREDYEIDALTSPRAAVAWSPRNWVTVRAGYERTFSIPVASFETVRLESFLSVGQNDFLPRTIRFGTNLAPETSDNFELGAVLRPITNLVVDLNYFRFELHGLVGTESLSASELLRDPATGRLIGAISELINGPDVETDGVDFSVRYDRDMLGGRLIATVDGIYLNKYDLLIPATATAPARVYTAAGFYNTRSGGPQGSPIVLGSFPEWKVNVGLTFEQGIHSLTGLMRYISEYDIHPSAGGANNCCGIPKIDSDVRFDLFYNVRLFDERTRLSLSILNLTDEDPPLAPQELGYDTSTHSFMTRTIKVSISQRFGGRN